MEIKTNLKTRRRRSKSQERRIADIFKEIDKETRKIGTLGAEDVVGTYCSIEVKGRKEIPKWIKKAFNQTRPEKNEDKICGFILHQHGQRHLEDFVVFKLKTFLELFEAYVKTKGEI